MEKLELEVKSLKKRVAKLESLLPKKPDDENEEDDDNESPKVDNIVTPKKPSAREYDIVGGWKIIDTEILNDVLSSAQQCGCSQLVLVEMNRKTMRSELASFLGFLCQKCGRQTLFPSSEFSHEKPANFEVNKEFSALGLAPFNSLVSLVQDERTIKKVPLDKKFRKIEPKFMFFGGANDETKDDEDDADKSEPKNEEIVVKEEPKDELEEDFQNFIEPSVCITEGTESGNIELEGSVDMDALLNPTIDVSTVTTNTPALALATVAPGTPVMGGSVTPHPPDQMITTNPNMFIRTTCSKILLPPGIYSYQRNNGLNSVMSVKADSGNFEDIESHYYIVHKPDKSNKVKSQPGNKRTSLQVFSAEIRDQLLKDPSVNKLDIDNIIIDRWVELTPDKKKYYQDKASGLDPKPIEPISKAVSKASGFDPPPSKSPRLEPSPPPSRSPSPSPEKRKKKKTSMNIPLPALKRFAAKLAPELKSKSPHLAKLENRGQLNKQILEQWVALSEEEKEKYKNMAKEGQKSSDQTDTKTSNETIDNEDKPSKKSR